jgi:hypothetical protein
MIENDLSILNPDIRETVVGIKSLRKIKVYPLSVIDQFKVTDMFTEAIGILLTDNVPKDIQLIALLISILKNNLPSVLKFVLDEEEDTEKLLSEMTNNQFTTIATMIYEMNYEIISKNVSSLLKKLPQTQKVSPSVRPLQPSVVSMDTNLRTSSENPGDKVD